MPNQSVLQFVHYSVEEIKFKHLATKKGENKFQIYPQFERKLIDKGNNRYDYIVSVDISSEENNPAPFELFVSIIGRFILKEDEKNPLDPVMKKNLLQKNTAAIMFPFLRSIVASITVNANIPSLILPVVNFSEECPEE